MVNENTLKKLKALGYKSIRIGYLKGNEYHIDYMMVKGKNIKMQIQNKDSDEVFCCDMILDKDPEEYGISENERLLHTDDYIKLEHGFKLYIMEKIHKVVLGTREVSNGDGILLYPKEIGGMATRDAFILTDESITKYMYLTKANMTVEIDNTEPTIGLYELVENGARVNNVIRNIIEVESRRIGECNLMFYETSKNMAFDLYKV